MPQWNLWQDGCFLETKKSLLEDNDANTLQASLSGTFLQTARTGYASEGALFTTDSVSALWKVWVVIGLEAT